MLWLSNTFFNYKLVTIDFYFFMSIHIQNKVKFNKYFQ